MPRRTGPKGRARVGARRRSAASGTARACLSGSVRRCGDCGRALGRPPSTRSRNQVLAAANTCQPWPPCCSSGCGTASAVSAVLACRVSRGARLCSPPIGEDHADRLCPQARTSAACARAGGASSATARWTLGTGGEPIKQRVGGPVQNMTVAAGRTQVGLPEVATSGVATPGNAEHASPLFDRRGG